MNDFAHGIVRMNVQEMKYVSWELWNSRLLFLLTNFKIHMYTNTELWNIQAVKSFQLILVMSVSSLG
jgi:hypothetical protein